MILVLQKDNSQPGFTMQPLRTKGWDKALVEFTAAMLTDTEFESKPPLSKRLHEISCPGKTPNSICLNGHSVWSS